MGMFSKTLKEHPTKIIDCEQKRIDIINNWRN